MSQFSNVKYHAEIRNLTTAQLIETLQMNGLDDCCDAVQRRQIDGDEFLNLKEGQLALWRNQLNNVQIKRLWSFVQLANERPKDFISNISKSKPMEVSRQQSQEQIFKVDKIQSPITQSLETILKQQNQTNSQVAQDGHIEQEPLNVTINNFPIKNKDEQILTLQHSSNVRKISRQDNFLDQQSEYPVHIPVFPQPNPNRNLPPKPMHLNIQQNNQIGTEKNNNSMVTSQSSYLHSNYNNAASTSNSSTSSSKYSRSIPTPSFHSRPLPSVPINENPFPLPQTVTPNIHPQIENLPRPPQLPDLLVLPGMQSFDSDDEQPHYDSVEETEQFDNYKKQPWYKNVSRNEASKLLEGKTNGSFIVRPSERPGQECSLSVICENRIYQLRILNKNNNLVIGGMDYSSVEEIIEIFMDTPLVLNGPNNEDMFVKLRQL